MQTGNKILAVTALPDNSGVTFSVDCPIYPTTNLHLLGETDSEVFDTLPTLEGATVKRMQVLEEDLLVIEFERTDGSVVQWTSNNFSGDIEKC